VVAGACLLAVRCARRSTSRPACVHHLPPNLTCSYICVPSEPNSLTCPAGPSDCEVMPCLRLSWYPPYRGKINPPLSEISDEKATAFLGSLDHLLGQDLSPSSHRSGHGGCNHCRQPLRLFAALDFHQMDWHGHYQPSPSGVANRAQVQQRLSAARDVPE